MKIKNIAGYKFVNLDQLSALREAILLHGNKLALRGTILLSVEGININLAGVIDAIEKFLTFLQQFPFFADIEFKESFSVEYPFKQFKVKIKKEIITLRRPEVNVAEMRAASISPLELKKWLDEKRDVTLVDTRNNYEIDYGTFHEATRLDIDHFTQFPSSINKIPRDKLVVMFCTGGIRCEKAAIFMLKQGYEKIYQLDGGILNYFATVGDAHYKGNCYVFDERVALKPDLTAIESKQEENIKK